MNDPSGATGPTSGNAAQPLRPARAPDVSLTGAVADTATERLAKVAHELGNLLDGALRYVSLARSRVHHAAPDRPESPVSHELDVAHQSLTRMATLVRDALSQTAKPLTGSLYEHRPLVEALAHACDLHRPLADERAIRIDTEISPRLVLLPAGAIYPVVANAVRNAIEAVGRDGSVRVIAELLTPGSSRTGEPEVQIDVIDDGPGPPPGAGDRVFDLGFTTKQAGLGVGLALAREVVREMGGWISLTPRLPDPARPRRGAHFCVRFRPFNG